MYEPFIFWVAPLRGKPNMHEVNFNVIIETQTKLKEITDMLKKSIDEIQARYDNNMLEIVKVMDDNQKRHASAMNEVNKTIESILNRK